jgi:lathosterol oxidase
MEHAFKIFLKIFGISAIRYFVIAGIPFILIYKTFSKLFTKNKIQNRQATPTDFWREIIHSLQTTVVLAILAYIVFFTQFKKYTLVYDDMSDYPLWWFWLSVALTFVLHDTYFYWMHRLLHHPKLFKYTHLLHHRSTNPSPWASYSFHFIESWTEGAILLVIVFVMPVHELTIVFFTIGGFVINVYGHLGYEVVPKRFIKSPFFQLFNTSVHHNLHHKKFNGNYGLYFRVWDRVMGTEHRDYIEEFERVQQNRFGDVQEERTNQVYKKLEQ